jgi:hypothetical protein
MFMKSTITKADLNQFTGTEQYYRHWLKGIVYTDGVKFVAESAGAFWLLDIVASYQPVDAEFQVWRLQKEGDAYSVVCTDGNDNVLLKQDIPYTDFPADLMPFELWYQNNVIFLPSEN